MENKIFGAALLLLTVFAVGLVAAFVQTVIVFSVDTSVSFTVFTLGASGAVGTNQTNSKSALPANFTENYYFNTTSNYAEWLTPCGAIDRTNCQAGMSIPAYRIRNTGNVNITIWMNLSTAPPTGVKVCANSTAPTGCGTKTISACNYGTLGELNATYWVNITQNIGTTSGSGCYDANVTLYANFSNVATGTVGTAVLTVNSTT